MRQRNIETAWFGLGYICGLVSCGIIILIVLIYVFYFMHEEYIEQNIPIGKKPIIDNSSYTIITLSNQLKIIIANIPNAPKAAASLLVSVGSM